MNQHVITWQGVTKVRKDDYGPFIFVQKSGQIMRVRPEPIHVGALWEAARETWADDPDIEVGSNDFASEGQKLWFAPLSGSRLFFVVGHRNGNGERLQLWASDKADAILGGQNV